MKTPCVSVVRAGLLCALLHAAAAEAAPRHSPSTSPRLFAGALYWRQGAPSPYSKVLGGLPPGCISLSLGSGITLGARPRLPLFECPGTYDWMGSIISTSRNSPAWEVVVSFEFP